MDSGCAMLLFWGWQNYTIHRLLVSSEPMMQIRRQHRGSGLQLEL